MKFCECPCHEGDTVIHGGASDTVVGTNEHDVELARIRKEEAIELAKIGARTATSEAIADAEAAEEHAEGVEEGLAAAVDALTPEAPEAEGQEPIVIHDGGLPPEEPELDAAPPPVIVADDGPKEPKKAGWWDGYR